MRGQMRSFAYWIQPDTRIGHEGQYLNCTRGPKDTEEEMREEVERIYQGQVYYIQLPYETLASAKPVLRDKIALLYQDAAKAMQRFKINSIPGAERLRYGTPQQTANT